MSLLGQRSSVNCIPLSRLEVFEEVLFKYLVSEWLMMKQRTIWFHIHIKVKIFFVHLSIYLFWSGTGKLGFWSVFENLLDIPVPRYYVEVFVLKVRRCKNHIFDAKWRTQNNNILIMKAVKQTKNIQKFKLTTSSFLESHLTKTNNITLLQKNAYLNKRTKLWHLSQVSIKFLQTLGQVFSYDLTNTIASHSVKSDAN